MAALNVPGVSIAVLHEGRIDWAAGYGVRDAISGEAVTEHTLFQAASISKSVSGMAAHRLAQEGLLDLEAPINATLLSWTLPADEFEGEVTARNIMSHTGGLGVHGFGGYPSFDEVPSVLQVLDGLTPANSPAVRRIGKLGKAPRYSGGGSTILQLALCDLTGHDFASLMSNRVLAPLGMNESTFVQPLPTDKWPNHASGHGDDGRPIAGSFHTYPEQYAAGLWTTPSDLARFAMEVQAAHARGEGRVLDQETAKGMLTAERPRMGLGVMLMEHGGDKWFGHGGSNMGFKCDYRASFEGGNGLFVMTNGDRGSQLAREILRAVAQVYGWPGLMNPGLPAFALEPKEIEAYVGRYGSEPDLVTYVTTRDGSLFLRAAPGREQRLAPIGKHRFLVLGTPGEARFQAPEQNTGKSGSLSLAGAQSQARLEDHEHWPMDDLLAGDVDAAIEFYREVFKDDPTDPMVSFGHLRRTCTSLWNAGLLETGLSLAQLISTCYPRNPESWFSLAEKRRSTQDLKGAAEAYTQCLAVTPEGGGGWMQQMSRSTLRALSH